MTTEIDKIRKLLNTDDAHMIAAAFLCEVNTGFDIEDICETCEEVESMYGPDRDFTFFGGEGDSLFGNGFGVRERSEEHIKKIGHPPAVEAEPVSGGSATP